MREIFGSAELEGFGVQGFRSKDSLAPDRALQLRFPNLA